MGNHRIRYQPRDGWEGTPFPLLRTVDLGAAPGLERATEEFGSALSLSISPGRDYRAIARDSWITYSIELRSIPEDSALFRDVGAFLAEADAGVEFEFAYDDAKTYSSTLSAFSEEGNQLFNVAASPVGTVAVGDWIFVRAAWRRSVFGYYKAAVVLSSTIAPEDTHNQYFDAGSAVRSRGFIPAASLSSHDLRKRRGGRGVDAWDLVMSFREVE